MARPRRGLEDFLEFASTPEWRSAILSAALCFAAFHLVAVLTPSLRFDASGAVAPLPQILHFSAVTLRFLLPTGFLAAGLFAYRRRLKVLPAHR